METVAIIMTCFNSERYLNQTLTSIAKQKFKDWKLYVNNDGSNDNTFIILKKFKDKFKNTTIINQKNIGQVKAKNKLLKIIDDHKYIAFIDSDDVWHSEKLARQIKYLEGSKYSLCYTDGFYINKNNTILSEIGINSQYFGSCLRSFLISNAIVFSSVLIDSSIIKEVGFFDESLDACENWDLWTRISEKNEIIGIKEKLVYYRKHANNMSLNIKKMLSNRLALINNNAKRYRNNFNDIDSITQCALYQCYYSFGKYELWSLNLTEAKTNLLLAIKYKPFCLKSRILYLKSCLGKSIILFYRKILNRQFYAR